LEYKEFNADMAKVLFMAIGWVSAAISLVRFPFIFGVVGVVMGILCSKNGSKAAQVLVVASILSIAASLAFKEVIYDHVKEINYNFKQIMGAYFECGIAKNNGVRF